MNLVFDRSRELQEQRWPEYARIIVDDNRRLEAEDLPQYHQLLSSAQACVLSYCYRQLTPLVRGTWPRAKRVMSSDHDWKSRLGLLAPKPASNELVAKATSGSRFTMGLCHP